MKTFQFLTLFVIVVQMFYKLDKNKSFISVSFLFRKQKLQHSQRSGFKKILACSFFKTSKRGQIFYFILFWQKASKIFSSVASLKQTKCVYLSSLWLPHKFQNFCCSWPYPSLSFPPPLRFFSSFYTISLPLLVKKRKQKRAAEKV